MNWKNKELRLFLAQVLQGSHEFKLFPRKPGFWDFMPACRRAGKRTGTMTEVCPFFVAPGFYCASFRRELGLFVPVE
jgi:hypothetical protein